MINLITVLEDLYESEINFQLSSFWDAGYQVMLGDLDNGFKEDYLVDTLGEVAESLAIMAVEHYPDSEFAEKYKGLINA